MKYKKIIKYLHFSISILRYVCPFEKCTISRIIIFLFLMQGFGSMDIYIVDDRSIS